METRVDVPQPLLLSNLDEASEPKDATGELPAAGESRTPHTLGGDVPDAGSTDAQARPSAVGLTLEDVEQMALANNPTLRIAGLGIDEKGGVRTQVGLRPNPVVGYSGVEIGNEGEAGQQGFFVSQTFVRGRKLQLNRAIANWDAEEARWIAETQRYRVLNDVRSSFYEALGAQRRTEIARQLVEIAEKGVASVEAQIRAAQAAKPDLLQAKVQLNEVQVTLQNAEIAFEAAWNEVASLTGQPSLAPTPLVGELPKELADVAWDDTYATLLSLSPELQQAEVRIQRARCAVARQQLQPKPNVLTQFGVANDFATDSVVTNIQVGVPLPVRNRNQGNVRAAYAVYHRAQGDAERIRLRLRQQLAQTLREYGQTRQQAERYRDAIVPMSRESFELIDAGYQQGEYDFLRVLTARRAYFEAQLAAVQSLVAANRASVAIDGLLLTGGLNAVPEANDTGELRGEGLRGQSLDGQ